MNISLYLRDFKIRIQRFIINLVITEDQRYNIEKALEHHKAQLLELKHKEKDLDNIDDFNENIINIQYILSIVRTKKWK